MRCKECGTILMSEDTSVTNQDLCQDCGKEQVFTKEVFGSEAFVDDDYRTAEEVIYGTI